MRHQKRLEQSTSARGENRGGDIEVGVKNQRNAAAGLKGERGDRDSTSKDPALILTSGVNIQTETLLVDMVKLRTLL